MKAPWVMVFTLIGVALITTYFAVKIPMKNVNKKRIAVVLKSGS